MILREIKKIIEDKSLNKEIDTDNLCSIIAYNIMQNEFFKEGYSYLGLIEDKKKTRLYIPYLNYAKGFTNHKMSEGFIETKYEEIEHYIEEHFYKNKNIYIKKEEIENLKDFVDSLKKDDVRNFEKHIKEKEEKDSLYVPAIYRFLFQEKSKESINLIKNIINSLDGKSSVVKNKRDINYMSEYSTSSGFFSRFNSSDEFYCNYIEEDLISKLVNYRKINELEPIKQKEKTIEYLESKKVPEELISVLIEKGNVEEKRYKVLNYYYNNLKEDLIKMCEEEIKKYRDINILITKYENEIKIVKKELEKNYIELNGNKEIEMSFLSGTNNIYEKIKDSNKLVLLSNESYLGSNLKLNGISYCSSDIKEDIEDNRKCLLLKTKNQVIGMLLFNEEEENIVKIDYVEINKNFRKQGLSKKIFEWLSDYSVKENKVIFSSMYTEEGGSYLPKTKKILNEKTKALFLDTENQSDKIVHEISNLNRYVRENVKKNENFNLKLFKKAYENNSLELVKELEKKEYLDYGFVKKISDKILEDYQKLLKKERKNKNAM